MDDPWGSPWATDDPSANVPKINLPTAPPPATLSNHSNSPRVSISSPWQQHNEDEAWGGWNDAKSGTSSPGWGRSPGLRPAMVRERDVSPGPWMGRKSEDRGVSDSAVVLEKERKLSVAEAQDTWHREEKKETKPPAEPESKPAEDDASASESGSPLRPESPDVPPPGPASRAEDRPELERPASKVQELVYMYDGIAKRGVSPAQSALVSPSSQKIRDENDEEWGEVVTSPTEDSPTKAIDVESPVEAPETAEITPATNGWPEDTGPEADTPPSSPQTTTKSKIDIPFPVDLSHLDSLFPSVPPAAVSPEPIPDVIIDDTFANIAERKTWYRVSRFGSMRKHNTGNDENYSRMDWTRSAARDKSLRIVRRWMEEDSIAGRVTLGARQKGAIGAGMFNWDSKAEPVDVGELLGRKKGHKSSGSNASKGSKADLASPVGATFGWNEQTAPSSTVPSFPAPFTSKINGTKTRPQSLIMPPRAGTKGPVEPAGQAKARPKSLIMPPHQPIRRQSIDQTLAISSPTARGPSPQTISKPVEDDDDDWGEMVTSPTLPTTIPFATVDTEAPRLEKPVEKITSPGAASFGWSETLNPSKTEPDQPQATLATEQQPEAPNFGWDDFEKPSQDASKAAAATEVQPAASFEWSETLGSSKTSPEQNKATPTTEPQPNASNFGWDDFGQPPQDAPKAAPATEEQAKAGTFDWDDFETPSQNTSKGDSTTEPHTATAMFGWDDFEKPSQDTLKHDASTETQPSTATEAGNSFETKAKDGSNAASTAWPQASEAMFGWDDFEKPSQATPKFTSTDQQKSSGATVEWDQPSSVVSNKESLSNNETPTSPPIASPLSPSSQALSLPSPVETTRPAPIQPLTKTPPPTTKKDDEIVAKILNDLPNLSYMLR